MRCAPHGTAQKTVSPACAQQKDQPASTSSAPSAAPATAVSSQSVRILKGTEGAYKNLRKFYVMWVLDAAPAPAGPARLCPARLRLWQRGGLGAFASALGAPSASVRPRARPAAMAAAPWARWASTAITVGWWCMIIITWPRASIITWPRRAARAGGLSRLGAVMERLPSVEGEAHPVVDRRCTEGHA